MKYWNVKSISMCTDAALEDMLNDLQRRGYKIVNIIYEPSEHVIKIIYTEEY